MDNFKLSTMYILNMDVIMIVYFKIIVIFKLYLLQFVLYKMHDGRFAIKWF